MLTALLLISAAPSPETLRKWGDETMAVIVRDHKNDRGYYTNKLGEGMVAYNWGVGVLLSAFAEAGPKWREEGIRYAKQVENYWNPAPPVPGFDVLPMPKPRDRYYDDNAWMVMALNDLATVAKRPEFRQRADAAMVYVMSGEVPQGGILWQEGEEAATRNTCSNAPAAAAQLSLYEKDRRAQRLKDAERIYDWAYRTLRDPSDNLMWDHLRKDGTVEKTKWSYNTGLMARSAAELYRVTKKPRYKAEAIAFAKAGAKEWNRLNNPGRFLHLLYEGYWHVARATGYDAAWRTVPGDLAHLYATQRSPEGRFSDWWNSSPFKPSPEMIDQASAARAFYFAANHPNPGRKR